MEAGRKENQQEPLLSEEERGCRSRGSRNVLAQQEGAGILVSSLPILCDLGQVTSILRASILPYWGLGCSILKVCLSYSNNDSGGWIF